MRILMLLGTLHLAFAADMPYFKEEEASRALLWYVNNQGKYQSEEARSDLRGRLSHIEFDYGKLLKKGINVLNPDYNGVFSTIKFGGKFSYVKIGQEVTIDALCKLIAREDSPVERINLMQNNLNDNNVLLLCEAFSKNSSAKSLNLRDNRITAKAIQALSRTSLESLDIQWCEDSIHILNATLKHLSLNKVGVEGARVLGEWLKTNTSLESLYLNCVPGYKTIGDDGVDYLADALRINTTLKILELDGNDIENISSLADVLKSNTTLQVLSLGANKLGDRGAALIADSLTVNEGLRAVNLAGNAIADEGACSLAESLRKNKSLVELHLHFNDIRDKGTQAIEAALLENPVIEYVPMML